VTICSMKALRHLETSPLSYDWLPLSPCHSSQPGDIQK
jgi:hypothetical protein